MSDELVTVASFSTEAEAHLVRSQLEEAGIQAFVSEGGLIGLTGVQSESKVLVAASDARRALTALAEAEDDEPAERPSPPSEAVTDRRPSSTAITREEPDETDGPPMTGREEMAVNALKAALLGVLLWPMHLYVSWLLWKVYVSDEELGEGPRGRAWLALAINVPVLFVLAVSAYGMFEPLWE